MTNRLADTQYQAATTDAVQWAFLILGAVVMFVAGYVWGKGIINEMDNKE
ncbi:MAG: hypothetical protein S4CHLAM102_05340 [Chlamydiia bacterium]|nr:hypothetical protein [Chlamydiia bacterium]